MNRKTADSITDDDLDQLYARIAELERNAAIDDEVIAKGDRETDELLDAGRKFKAWAEQWQAWGEQQKARADRAESAIAQGLAVAEVIEANGITWAADSIRRALAPAQRPSAATGSGAATPTPSDGLAPSRAHSGP